MVVKAEGAEVDLMDAAVNEMLNNPESLKEGAEGSDAEPEGGTEGEQGEEGAAGKTVKPSKAASAEEPDDEKFMEANAGKAVPYDRFKKVMGERKSLKEKLAALEAGGGDAGTKYADLNTKYTDLEKRHQAREANFVKLGDMLADYPPLEAAIEALVKGGGKLSPELLAEAVAGLQELVKAPAGADPKAPGAGTDPKLLKQLKEMQDRLDQRDNSEKASKELNEASRAYEEEIRNLKSSKSEIRKKIEEKHPGLEVDQDFMAEVIEAGTQAARVAEIENKPRPSLYAIAEAVAGRHFSFKNRLLGNRARTLDGKKGAGLERAGGPAGKKIPKMPPIGTPEWDKWALANPDYLTSDPDDD